MRAQQIGDAIRGQFARAQQCDEPVHADDRARVAQFMATSTSAPRSDQFRIVRNGAGSSATGRGLDLGQPGETVDIHRMDGTTLATCATWGGSVGSSS